MEPHKSRMNTFFLINMLQKDCPRMQRQRNGSDKGV